MEAKAVAKYIRISPYKARILADLVRGKDVRDALAVLKFTPNKAGELIGKVLQSAIANAEHNYDMNRENLYISRICIDQGPSMKRYKPRAMGRADVIMKKSSHITVVVSEKGV